MESKDVQAFFERVACDWDTMRLAYYDERVIERMVAVSGAVSDMAVADIGTGTGFVAAGIAPKVGRVLAVDNSPAMLEVARKNLTDLGIANVELLEGDIGSLPLKAGISRSVVCLPDFSSPRSNSLRRAQETSWRRITSC